MPATPCHVGHLARFLQLRAVVLLAVVVSMVSFLTIIRPDVSGASTQPTPTCSAGTASDSCTVTGTTSTSVSVSYSVKFIYPVCHSPAMVGDSNACVYSVATSFDASGAGTKAMPNTDCPWKSGITSNNYSTAFAEGSTGFTCTQTWSFGVSDVPADLTTNVRELNGDAQVVNQNDHRFDINYPRPAPSPSFTYTPDSSTRGLYHFVSTSTGSSALTYVWLINGDNDGSGQTFDFTFSASDTYSVDLRATDQLNQTSDSVQSVKVTLHDLFASISLTGADGKPFTGGATAVGQTLNATVTLRNASTTAAITGISANPPLSVDPSTALSPTGGPTPAVPGTVPAGSSTSYVMSYTVLTPGRAKLSVHATGSEGSDAQTADAVVTANLGQPIAVTTVFLQNGHPLSTLKLADADAGEVPQDITAEVTLTNISSTDQLGVTVNGLPVPSFHTGTHALPSVPLSVTGGAPANVVVGTLAAGTTSAPLDYTVNVRDNGVFDLSTQVLSSDSTGTTTNVSTGLGTLTVLPTAYLWLSLTPIDTAPVQAGTEVEERGTLTNRSETQAVFSNPLEPDSITGNAGGGRLVDDTSPANLALSYLADGVQIPFLGRVEPGQKITLKGLIDTAAVPTTRATLTYQPTGQIINDDGSRTDLREDQVGKASGTSPVTIAISAADPAVPAADLETEIQNFENSVVQGTGNLAEANFRAAVNFLQHPYDGTVKGVSAVAGAIVRSPRDLASATYIIAAVEVYSTVYGVLTPQQRANFEAGILADFDASYVKADNAEVSKAIDEGFGSFADAVAHHDYNKVASLAGNGVAIAGNAIATALLTDIFFQKLNLGLKGLANTGKQKVNGFLSSALVLADESRSAGLARKIIKTTDGIKAGQNLLINNASALVNAWGLTPEQITKLVAFCKQNKLIIAVRARSKRAAQLIARGLAVGKNEILKLKGVNEIDIEWLGYSQADANKLINAEPVPYNDLVDELLRKHADRTTEAIVLERWKLRFDEWHSPKVRGVMEKASKEGTIEWGFNGKDNGVPAADRSGTRRFKLNPLKGYEFPHAGSLKGKPRIYEQVLVGNREGPLGKLVGVTQDVDAAAVLNANNTIPTAALRKVFYEFLSDAIGIEHPETVSWINDGDILFAAKHKELARLFQGGGETLAIFGPDGLVRAGFINPALTIYNAATKGGTIIFDGGYNNVYSKVTASATVNLKKFF